jgi:hypothetical protein
MAKIPESRHMTVLSTKHFFGQRLAAVVACALLLGVLLTAGCDQTTTQARTSGTRTAATPTVTLQPAPLSWETVNLPPGNLLPGLNNNLGELSVAPNDGTTAYACAAPVSLSAGATIWVTHDRGQHWRQLAPLPVVAQQLTYCWIVPDAVNPNIAVAELSWAPMKNLGEPAFMQGTHFVTFDGGARWQPLSGPTRFDIRWMATYHGTTIAAVEAAVPGLAALWISHDLMQTWQSGAMLTGWDGLSINPATGELVTSSGGSALAHLRDPVWQPAD